AQKRWSVATGWPRDTPPGKSSLRVRGRELGDPSPVKHADASRCPAFPRRPRSFPLHRALDASTTSVRAGRATAMRRLKVRQIAAIAVLSAGLAWTSGSALAQEIASAHPDDQPAALTQTPLSD